MDLLKVIERFPTQESCIEHLEGLRWGKTPYCPHCGSINVKKQTEAEIERIGRYNYHDCSATFKGTLCLLYRLGRCPKGYRKNGPRRVLLGLEFTPRGSQSTLGIYGHRF